LSGQSETDEIDNTATLETNILPPHMFEILCGGGCQPVVQEGLEDNESSGDEQSNEQNSQSSDEAPVAAANRQMKLRLLLPHPPAPGAAPHRYR